MTTRIIRDMDDIDRLASFLRMKKLPVTVQISQGASRSLPQNRLMFQWCKEIAEQLEGWTATQVRAYSKLNFGVPILRAESETFREAYDSIIKPLPYQAKLAMMTEPFDFAVTRQMTTAQAKQYLDAVQQHWSGQGVVLTDPEMLKYGAAA